MESESPEILREMSAPSPAVAVEPLEYAPVHEMGAWASILNALSLAAGVMGLEQTLRFGGFGITLTNGGFHELSVSAATTMIGLTLQGIAALTMIIASIACLKRFRWGRWLMIDAAILMICASAVGVLGIAIGTYSLPSTYMPRPRLPWLSLLWSTFPAMIERFILPALLIWLMTRPQVRKQFGLSE